MAIDTKNDDLQGLRIDRSARGEGEPAGWARRTILIGIAIVVLLSLSALAYRLLSADTPEVEVVRASAESSDAAGVVLSATGYIIPHHKINVNSKVTGRVAWIGVEKGDKVKEGQVLVRLEDDEFRAQYNQAKGAAEAAQAYLDELEHGSRPEEVQQAQHNLDEIQATLADDKSTLDRTHQLFGQGVVSRQSLDDATAKYEADQQRANSLLRAFQLVKLGPRAEEIARGTILERTAEKGELVTAQFASGAEGGPQGEVVALADLDDIQADLDIAQDDFAKLSPRQKAIITVDAFPDRKYDGVIAEMSPEANRQKATVEVKVEILKPDSYLRPEMNTTVKFLADEAPKTTSSQPKGVFVPATAVHDQAGKKVVFIAFDGKALLRPVEILSQRSGGFLVTGLVGGENVITTAPPSLKDGDKIKIKGQS